MSQFLQNLNPFTGKITWELEDEHYDYHQEIARSMYADMLHDTDRNKKYYDALEIAIKRRHSLGQKANVLDIGTGTGLLSMMAAKCNADSIIACEAFPPIADIARKVIAENGFSDRIKVISKRSTELEVGPGKDLEFLANILVTEVFDTELIGEGAIETFNHAKAYLLEPGSDVIPNKSRVYATIVESDLLSSCNKFKKQYPLESDEGINIPEDIVSCPGTNGVHDLQLSQLSDKDFTALIPPVEIFTFDFGGHELLKYSDECLSKVKAIADGEAQAVFMWWELDMDEKGEIVVTCAPKWANEESPWRDHWMQAVYHLPESFRVEHDQEFCLLSSHDEFSLWFNVYHNIELGKDSIGKEKAPICSCGAHIACSRTRISEMNCMNRWKMLTSLTPPKDSSILCIGDFSLLPMALAKYGVNKVYYVEENSVSFNTITRIIKYNNLEDKIILLNEYNRDSLKGNVDFVLCEPYFAKSIYPWDNLKSIFIWDMIMPEAEIIFPRSARIVAVAMSFSDLHKIKIPLGSVEGFDLRPFDELIEGSSLKTDSEVETQPLWEYPGVALSGPVVIYELQANVGCTSKRHESQGSFNIKRTGKCHGIALWVDYFGDNTVISGGGPLEYIVPGKKVRWNTTARQGLYLFRNPFDVDEGQPIEFSFELQPSVGKIGFKFKPKPFA